MGGRAWTQEDDNVLRWNWGDWTLASFAKKLDRTTCAVKYRAFVIGLHAPARGTETYKSIAKRTGYDERTLRGVVRKLGLRVRTRPSLYPGPKKLAGWSALEPEQISKVLDFLAAKPDGKRVMQIESGQWGVGGHAAACVGCHRADRPRHAKNRCKACYEREGKPKIKCGVCGRVRVKRAQNVCSACWMRGRYVKK